MNLAQLKKMINLLINHHNGMDVLVVLVNSNIC